MQRNSVFSLVPGLVLGACLLPYHSGLAAPGDDVVRGALWSGSVRGKGKDEMVAMKGLAITVSKEDKAYWCYDTDLMRPSLAWTGEFLEFGNTLTKIEWPPPPQVKGTPSFSTKVGPGFALNGNYDDPRPNQQGPLPKSLAHYSGLYVNGEKIVLSYTVGASSVLELPGYQKVGSLGVFTRTFNFQGDMRGVEISLAQLVSKETAEPIRKIEGAGKGLLLVGAPARLAIGFTGDAVVAGHSVYPKDQLWARLAGGNKTSKLKIWYAALSSETDADLLKSALSQAGDVDSLTPLCKGGPARWNDPVVTQGSVGEGDGPYLVDTITEPVPNPWNAHTFFGGFDFFSDGRAAICTFHGDVWVVSGIDQGLGKLTWKRMATGLFQPLGLKIVKDQVYVLGRDQITRLHDLNKDGEADFYENFNNDTVVTANYHEFCLDLHTDSKGNFYFAKGAPWTPDVTSPHQGTLIKVSKDGKSMEIFATGFRAPNGSAIGPNDEITVSDNQGHWMPSSKVNWVKKGGFYGMTPSAHRPLKLARDGTNFVANPSDPLDGKKFKFKSWDKGAPQPESYDLPLCWLPMNMDNSSGGQAFVTSSKWGPFKNDMLFMSYGRCTLFHVMHEEVDGVRQGGMTQFPLKFQSGLMRARFNPKDGQLYVAGLKGWQTSATKEGGFYRVRYNGKPVRMTRTLKAASNGFEIGFTCPLDEASVKDVGSYAVEQWNYQWTGGYGSPEFSVQNPTQKKHDVIEVRSARLLSDKRTVFLDVGNVKPSDQFRIRLNLKAADGSAISQEIYNTVYKTASAKQ